MAKATASPILDLIRREVEDQRVRALPDQELLQRFHGQQDQAAFHALLRRHGPMVLDVCRGVLGNEADAEDAFQATFLILARKAGSIRKTASLGSWLHGVAYRTALKARAQAAARQRHEARVPVRQASEPDDLSWREVRQVLHEELSGLPERYHAPLVLCYLEGTTQEAAAVELNLAKSTLRERLERGRTLLRTRLIRRGLGPAAWLIAAAWPAANASASVPVSLVVSTVKAASVFAAGQGAATSVLSAKVAAITEGVLKAMLITKLKCALAVLAVLTALALGAGTALQRTSAQPPPGKKNDAAEAAWKAAGTLEGHESAVLCLAFGPDQVLVASDEGPRVRVWDAATKKELRFYKIKEDTPKDRAITGITYAADNSWVSFREQNAIHMAYGHYIREGKPVDTGTGFGSDVPLALAADGKTYAFQRRGDTKTVAVVVWDWKNRGKHTALTHCKGHEDEAVCGAFSADAALLVTGCADKTARVWEASSGNEKHTLRGHTDAILVVAFSPDGKRVATGGKDGLVKLWDVDTGKERASLKGHTVVRCLAFSPDGKTLATGGEDETLRVWDVATAKEQVALKEHKGTVLAVGFSRDGSLLASAGQDKTIRLWKNAK